MDVAIIGIGLHRFGRSPELSGMQQGASAVRAAAVLEWYPSTMFARRTLSALSFLAVIIQERVEMQ